MMTTTWKSKAEGSW